MDKGGEFPVNDFIDRLRVTAERDLAPFQRRDRFGRLEGRAEGFALFVIEALHRLKAQPGLRAFGLEVKAHVTVEQDYKDSVIVVVHEVKAIEEGIIREPIDINEFYTKYFPFNVVMQGKFSISRQDSLAQRYLKALENKDIFERRAVLAILCTQASDAFSISELKVVPPPTTNADIPFITEPT